MTEKSFDISAEKRGEQFLISLSGELLIGDMGRLRDALIQHAGGHNAVVVEVYPEDEVNVSVLQVLIGIRKLTDAEVIIHTGESAERKQLLEKSGFSAYLEIKN